MPALTKTNRWLKKCWGLDDNGKWDRAVEPAYFSGKNMSIIQFPNGDYNEIRSDGEITRRTASGGLKDTE